MLTDNIPQYLKAMTDEQIEAHTLALDHYLDHLDENDPDHPIADTIREALAFTYTEELRRLDIIVEDLVELDEINRARSL